MPSLMMSRFSQVKWTHWYCQRIKSSANFLASSLRNINKAKLKVNLEISLFFFENSYKILSHWKKQTEMDALKICLIILLDIPNTKEAKDYFFSKAMSMYEDILTIGKLAELVLRCILVYRSLLEFTLILDLLEMKG